jgi:hypothetical protein
LAHFGAGRQPPGTAVAIVEDAIRRLEAVLDALDCGFRPSRSAIPADADHPFRQGDHPGRDAAG